MVAGVCLKQAIQGVGVDAGLRCDLGLRLVGLYIGLRSRLGGFLGRFGCIGLGLRLGLLTQLRKGLACP
jgi:hypothetical protein